MNREEIDEQLQGFGVFPGARRERSALAATLAERGFGPDWMDLLWTHAKATGKRPDALLVSWLTGEWRILIEIVEDLRVARQRAQERGEVQKPRDAMPSHYAHGRLETIEQQAKANGQDVADYLRDGEEQFAFCRVAAERRTVAECAQEMGWTEDRVICAIERWAPTYGRVAAEVIHDADPANREAMDFSRAPRRTVQEVLDDDDARQRRQSHMNAVTREADPEVVERLRKADAEMVEALDAKFIVDNAAVLALPQAGLVEPAEIDKAYELIQTNRVRARLEEAERIKRKLYGKPEGRRK